MKTLTESEMLNEPVEVTVLSLTVMDFSCRALPRQTEKLQIHQISDVQSKVWGRYSSCSLNTHMPQFNTRLQINLHSKKQRKHLHSASRSIHIRLRINVGALSVLIHPVTSEQRRRELPLSFSLDLWAQDSPSEFRCSFYWVQQTGSDPKDGLRD